MEKMKRVPILAGLFICLASLIYEAEATCVLESDFGFTINCAFKKSGLFRVRNLGGIKAHVGLGFSVGDELGFGQSLTNLDPSRRRSVSVKNGAPPNAITDVSSTTARQEKRGKQNRLNVRQQSPSAPNVQGQLNAQKLASVKAAMANLQRRSQIPTTMQPIVVPGGPTIDTPITRNNPVPKVTIAKPLPMSVPPFRPLPPKDEAPLSVLPITSTRKSPQIPQAKGPGLAYSNPDPHGVYDLASQIYPVYSQNPTKKLDDYNSISGYGEDSSYKFTKDDLNMKITQIAQAGNISMEAVEAAILLRQQQLLNQYANIPIPTTTSTTSTTELPMFKPEPSNHNPVTPKQKRYPMASGSAKVMNAPREYYPIGYEKNFDDQFESKVELPETPFFCGDQKYFPGLYADENLGCMVFHVCALTDDGLVMKSFLCPESTLFDQTILKCNWWFYVDCKSSRRLYDTNIPVSKSYQLMKALTFFSSYKKENVDGGQVQNPEDIDGIKEAIAILGNQDTAKAPASATVEIVTAQPVISSRPSIIRVSSSKYNGTSNHRMDREFKTNSSKTSSRSQRNSTAEDSHVSGSQNIETVVKKTASSKTVSFSAESSSSSEKSSKERSVRRRQNVYSLRGRTSTTTTTAKPTQPTTVEPKVDTTTIKVEIATMLTEPQVYEQNKTEQSAFEVSNESNMTAVNVPKFQSEEMKTAVNVSILSEEIQEIVKPNEANEEMSLIKNEKVQIVRPTPTSELVGQFPTPTATIAALDQAILGSLSNKQAPNLNLAQATSATLHASYAIDSSSSHREST